MILSEYESIDCLYIPVTNKILLNTVVSAYEPIDLQEFQVQKPVVVQPMCLEYD